MNIDILLGKTTEHLVSLEGTKYFIHHQMLTDFLKLQRDANADGLNLQIVSAFRDYNRQLTIWNAKASGQRPVLDDFENPINLEALSPIEKVLAILRWSALPGCSRHHWGTDVDIYNANTQTAEEVKLIPSECSGNGPSSKLHEWLDMKIDQKSSHGFFRPYATDRGGVSPERWHISYYPLSRRIMESYSSSLFIKSIEGSDMLLKDIVLENADEIFNRFFLNIDLP